MSTAALTIVDPGPAPAAPPADARREYVLGQSWAWYNAMVAAVPSYLDPLEADFGPRVFDDMLLDAQVEGAINIRRDMALAKGWTLNLPPALDPGEEVQAQAILDFCRKWLLALGNRFRLACRELLGALAYRHVVAESVWDYRQFTPGAGPQIVPVDLKVKPRENVVIVVDPYGNELGLLAVQPGQSFAWFGVLQFTRDADGVYRLVDHPEVELIPRSKFVVHKHHPGPGRALLGRSVLPACWPHWWAKRGLDPEYQKYLVQFASPSKWGTPGEKATPYTERDANNKPIPGGRTIYPEEAMLDVMEGARNGSARVYPYGSEEHDSEMQGDGSPFLKAYDYRDRNIVLAILKQELATKEGQHDSRAATDSHQDILTTVIQGDRTDLAATIVADLLTPAVRWNYGDAAVEAGLVPALSFGEVDEKDKTALITAVANLRRAGGIHRSQEIPLATQLGLPPIDEAEWAADQEAAQAARAAATQAAQNPPPDDAADDPAAPDKGANA